MRWAWFVLLSTVACAGTGQRYDQTCDAGPCSTPDGGPPDTTAFLSQPVRVFHDGFHAAATDATLFAGAAVVAFRSAPTFTADATSKIVLARSIDRGASWVGAGEVSVAGLDTRSPKLVVDGGHLVVIFTAWDARDPREHRTEVMSVAVDEGGAVGKPGSLGLTTGVTLGRPRVVQGGLVAASWLADELIPASTPTALSLFSGATVSALAALGTFPTGPGAHEADLFVRANGELWSVIPEREQPGVAARTTVCHGKSLAAFSCFSTNAGLDAPVLTEDLGLLYVVGGHDLGDGHRRTAVWQVDDDSLSLLADFPHGFGDTGGPGLVPLGDGKVLVTYHSTSFDDPKVLALGHEPSLVEAEGLALPCDIESVTLDLRRASSGR